MKEDKQTKWAVEDDWMITTSAQIADNEELKLKVAEVWQLGYTPNIINMHANLIAAAPDLLAACQDLLTLAESLEIDKFGKIYSTFKFGQIRQIIENASGENLLATNNKIK